MTYAASTEETAERGRERGRVERASVRTVNTLMNWIDCKDEYMCAVRAGDTEDYK